MSTLNFIGKPSYLFCYDSFNCSIVHKDRIWLTYSDLGGSVKSMWHSRNRRCVFSLLLQKYIPGASEQQLCDDVSQGSEQYWKDVCELHKISWFVWFYCLHPSRICTSCEGMYHVGGKEKDCKWPCIGWLKSYFPLKQAWPFSYASFGDKFKHQLSRLPNYTSLPLVIAFRNRLCVALVRVPGRLHSQWNILVHQKLTYSMILSH